MTLINIRTLRSQLSQILERVRKGERFTILYQSRPVYQLIPLGEQETSPSTLEEDPLYRTEAVGRSTDDKTAADHDDLLYGPRG